MIKKQKKEKFLKDHLGKVDLQARKRPPATSLQKARPNPSPGRTRSWIYLISIIKGAYLRVRAFLFSKTHYPEGYIEVGRAFFQDGLAKIQLLQVEQYSHPRREDVQFPFR